MVGDFYVVTPLDKSKGTRQGIILEIYADSVLACVSPGEIYSCKIPKTHIPDEYITQYYFDTTKEFINTVRAKNSQAWYGSIEYPRV